MKTVLSLIALSILVTFTHVGFTVDSLTHSKSIPTIAFGIKERVGIKNLKKSLKLDGCGMGGYVNNQKIKGIPLIESPIAIRLCHSGGKNAGLISLLQNSKILVYSKNPVAVMTKYFFNYSSYKIQ